MKININYYIKFQTIISNYFNIWKWNVSENDNKLWSEVLYRHQKYLIKLALRVSSQSLRGVSQVSLVASYSNFALVSLSLCCSFVFFFKSEVENSILVNQSRSRERERLVSIVINVTISFDLMRSSLDVFDLSFFSSQVIKAKI